MQLLQQHTLVLIIIAIAEIAGHMIIHQHQQQCQDFDAKLS